MAELSLPIESGPEVPTTCRQTGSTDDADFEPIRAAIKGIRFGEVRVIIQNSIVIQIDRLEKRRIK